MTRFWEGGKGNRNTRALSKNDSKKSVVNLMSSSIKVYVHFLVQVRGPEQNHFEACRAPSCAQVQVNRRLRNNALQMNFVRYLQHILKR
jgi:hypothetical protein